MGFAEDLAKHSEQVRKRLPQVVGEEATKMALIVPFLSILGFDVYDPSEVIPEYTADFATKKKGQCEKVDYAISLNNSIAAIIEAKPHDQSPESHDGQLSRYFNGLVGTKVAIVTNGLEYRFFTDLRNKNVMDKDSFFVFKVLDYTPKDLESLKFFHRDNLDSDAISALAEEMVYVKQISTLIGFLLRNPSESFIRFILGEIEIDSRITTKVIQKFTPMIKKAIQASLVDLMTRSLTQEIDRFETVYEQEEEAEEYYEVAQEEDIPVKVVTTEEEIEAYEIIKAITEKSPNYRLLPQYKDVSSYFGIHLGNPNWWFLRLYLSPKRKSFVTRLPVNQAQALANGLIVQELSAPQGGACSRIVLNSIQDLYKVESLIIKCYELELEKHP